MVERRIRDPIHGYIFLSPDEQKIVDTPYMQRLRYIKQSGTTYLTYPSALHSRFEHSLGTFKIASFTIDTLINKYKEEWKKEYSEDVCDNLKQLLRTTALIHDIGHVPFSHAGETALEWLEIEPKKGLSFHENLVIELIQKTDLLSEISIDSNLIIKILLGVDIPELPWKVLTGLIKSQLDVDKFDYLLRDGYFTGADFGKIDIERIITDLYVAKDHVGRDIICLSHRSISSAETLIMERYKLYRWVYLHPKVILTDEILGRVIYNAIKGEIFNINDFHLENINESSKCGCYVDDYSLIEKVRNFEDGNNEYCKNARNYLKMLLKRELPKAIWKNQFERDNYLDTGKPKFLTISKDPKLRFKFEENLYDKLCKNLNGFGLTINRNEIVLAYKKFDVYKLQVDEVNEIQIYYENENTKIPLSKVRPFISYLKDSVNKEAMFSYIYVNEKIKRCYSEKLKKAILLSIEETEID